MDIYRSRIIIDRDMRDLVETNKLYEIVKYYGGYLHYCKTPKTEEKTYNEFYNNNCETMGKIFINLANASAKSHFSRRGVSGRRMRQMLITKGGKRVIAYEWISEYVEYILERCIESDELRIKVLEIMYKDCYYCREQENIEEWKKLCAKRLLGFQYTLLNEVGKRKVKASDSALENIYSVINSNFINIIVESCPIIMKKC